MNDFLGLLFPYDYAVRIALVTAIAAYGCYITLRAGVFAVPQAGIMAIGAYTSAVLSVKVGVPVPLAQASGIAAGALTGFILSLALGRLDGIRLAIATIAFSEIVRVLLLNIPITGGGTGLVGIRLATTDWQIVGAAVLCLVLFARFAGTPSGEAMLALQADPMVASHQGVSTFRYRVAVFVAAGLVSGTAGVLYAHLGGFLVPEAFGFGQLTTLLAAAIVGGMGLSAGPLVGAAIVTGIPEIAGQFQNYRYVFNGLLIIAVIAFAPGGAAMVLRHLFTRVLGGMRWTGTGAAPAVPAAPAVQSGDIWSPAGAPPLLELYRVSKRYGGVNAVQDVSFSVHSGEMLGLIGPNGSGKTTLLNALSGVSPPSDGGFSFNGVESAAFAGHPERAARLGLSRTFQGIRLVRDLDVAANIRLGAFARRKAGAPAQLLGAGGARAEEVSIRNETRKLMAELGIDAAEDASVAGLPYGTLRRIEIARALISHPRLLLLDEPAAGMTARETAEVFGFMRSLCARGLGIIVVEHDVAAIAKYCDRIAVLNFGRLLMIGSPNEVVTAPAVVEAYIGSRTRV